MNIQEIMADYGFKPIETKSGHAYHKEIGMKDEFWNIYITDGDNELPTEEHARTVLGVQHNAKNANYGVVCVTLKQALVFSDIVTGVLTE